MSTLLLGLPRELRDKIYDLVLTKVDIYQVVHQKILSHEVTPKRPFTLMAVSKALRADSSQRAALTPIAYHFQGTDCSWDDLGLPKHILSQIQTLYCCDPTMFERQHVQRNSRVIPRSLTTLSPILSRLPNLQTIEQYVPWALDSRLLRAVVVAPLSVGRSVLDGGETIGFDSDPAISPAILKSIVNLLEFHKALAALRKVKMGDHAKITFKYTCYFFQTQNHWGLYYFDRLWVGLLNLLVDQELIGVSQGSPGMILWLTK
jgi:hypothetical protein